ncbi:MAG: thiol protease/hemagglutinin PrtT [Bacteroidia bacterium]
MKKISYYAFAFVLAANVALAKPVTPITAKTVAENFYKKSSAIALQSSTLAYTQLAADGSAVYYVYNINGNDGFVIVSAEDATKPVLGYSTESHFSTPTAETNINFWLNNYAASIANVKAKGIVANAKTVKQWATYLNNTQQSNRTQSSGNGVLIGTPVVGPLMKTIWNQNPVYNSLCPGGSVTGCVATTMAQIMKYWSYPAHGTGSSSYTQNPNPNGYSVQSANYGTSTYNWANMPLNSANTDIATLMYECGVSVHMNYAPSGSGAQVLQADAGIGNACAQRSYTTYFSYDPTTIQGIKKYNYDDATWLGLIENDLNIGRVVQYVGYDPAEGGHTWVCDGYDSNDYLHMNWGWGGSDNGYFQTDSLLTTNGGFNPSSGQEALIGIIPIAAHALDASIQTITSPVGAYCSNNFTPVITLKNNGSTTLTSCVISYQIDNGTVQTINWTGSLVNQQSTTISLANYTSAAGAHTLTCSTSSPNGSTDANPANDQSVANYNVGSMAALPVVEGFESAVTASSSWLMSASSTGSNWAITSNAAATGANSLMVDNINNIANNASTLQTSASYNLSTFNSPTLTFKAAYQQKATASNDKLQVFTSTDCGATWVSRRAFTATSLAALSGGPGTVAYMPSASQFTTYTVNINAVATNNTVMFKWVFTAGTSIGNNVYLDDINIVDAAAAGIKNIEATTGLNIYPNPSAGIVNVSFNLTEKQNVSVNVVDMLGRTVETIPAQQYASGETVLTIGSKAYQAGVYFVNINMNGQQVSKKIIVE